MAEQEERKLTREEHLKATKEKLLFEQKLAREGKLSAYLRAEREVLRKEAPDWDVLL